ncbi:MAG: hypothetical protein M0006_10210 [Magnetospirillum sp.]|nr:hypothetical protein [Magnetospirillum sp.]
MIEAYKIGVEIALHNKVSEGLRLVTLDFAKADMAAVKLKSTLNEIKLLGGIGMAMAGAGYAGLHVLDKAYQAAKEYETAYGRFKSLNLGEAVNQDANKFAQGANLMGVTATELIGTMRTLSTIFGAGHYDIIKAVAPTLAQMQFANKAVFQGHGRAFDDKQMEDALKVIEMRGGWKSADDLKRQLDMIQHVMSGTGGMVMPSDMLGFLKTGGTAAKNLNDQAFYYGMEPLIQEMGGGRAGTGLMSGYQNLVLGKGTTAAAKELLRLHLVDVAKVEFDKIGHVKRIKPGALKDGALYQSNPQAWLANDLLPTLAKDGIKIDRKVIEEISYLFGNRTGAMLVATMFQQSDKIAKNVATDMQAMGVADLIKLARRTPEGAEAALAASWMNLKIAAGESLIPIVIPALNDLASGLRHLGTWIEHHPVRFKYLVDGFAGLSTALAFGGAVFAATAAIKGLGLVFQLPGMLKIGSAAAGMEGISTAAAAATVALGPLTKALGVLGTFVLSHEVLKALDPQDKTGAWVDRYVPGASWIDNAASKVGLGRSYAEQAQAAHALGMDKGDGQKLVYAVPPAPSQMLRVHTAVNLDGRKVGEAVHDYLYDQMNRPQSGPSTFDGRQSFVPVGAP